MLQKVRKQALLWYDVVITQREAFTIGIVFLHGVHGVHTQQGSHCISANALHCNATIIADLSFQSCPQRALIEQGIL